MKSIWIPNSLLENSNKDFRKLLWVQRYEKRNPGAHFVNNFSETKTLV